MNTINFHTNASKSPADFCAAHSISRPTFHRLVSAGKLEARKIGRRTIVTAEAERKWLETSPKGGQRCTTMTTLFTVIETPFFSKLRPDYWTETERAAFAVNLAENPNAGDVIEGSSGCRKVRWNRSDIGKSGGVRVIYFNRLAEGCLVLLVMYAKSAKDTIAADILRKIAKEFGNATQ